MGNINKTYILSDEDDGYFVDIKLNSTLPLPNLLNVILILNENFIKIVNNYKDLYRVKWSKLHQYELKGRHIDLYVESNNKIYILSLFIKNKHEINNIKNQIKKYIELNLNNFMKSYLPSEIQL